jgi:hypothetical protein
MISRHVQTGCGAHATSCLMVTGVLSRWDLKLTTYSHLVHRLTVWSYTYTPPISLHGTDREKFTHFYLIGNNHLLLTL